MQGAGRRIDLKKPLEQRCWPGALASRMVTTSSYQKLSRPRSKKRGTAARPTMITHKRLPRQPEVPATTTANKPQYVHP